MRTTRHFLLATVPAYLLALCGACGGTGPNPTPDIVVDPDGGTSDCVRNEPLLRSLGDAPLACTRDDECPAGSHCDLDTGLCRLSCLPIAEDPAGGCPADVPCDCHGRCATSDAPQQPVGGQLTFSSSAVSLSPTSGRVSRTTSSVPRAPPRTGSAMVEAEVVLPDDIGSRAGAVTFHATAGLLVRCRQGEAAATRCQTMLRAGHQAITLEVEADAATPEPGPWTLSFTSRTLFPRSGSISVLAPAEGQQPAGQFEGLATPCGDSSAPALAVPLAATVTDGEAVVTATADGPWPRAPLRLPLGRPAAGAVEATSDGPFAVLWQGVTEAASGDGTSLRGLVRLTFAPDSVAQWCIGLRNSRADGSGSAAPPPSDSTRRALELQLDQAAGQLTPIPAVSAVDARHRAWREHGRSHAAARNFYHDLGQVVGGDGRSARQPAAADAVVFRPGGDTLAARQDLAITVGAHDFAQILAIGEYKVWDGQHVDDYGGIVARAWYRVRRGAAYMPCIPKTFAADGPLTQVDCAHVLGPVSLGDHGFDRCSNTDAQVWHCPGGSCAFWPTPHHVWLCPVGSSLPSSAAEVAEATLCDQGEVSDDVFGGRRATLFAAHSMGARGELACRSGSFQQAVPLLTGPSGAVPDRLDFCLDELNQEIRTADRDPWRGPGAARAACLQPVAFHTALGGLLEVPSLPSDGERLLQNLLRQWLDLHTYVANEATRRGELDALVRAEAGSEQQAAQLRLHTPYDDVDETVAQGLQFMLGAAVAPALARIDGATLAAPDYRADHHVAGSVDDVQKVGLSVPILDAAASYLRFTAHRLSRLTAAPDLSPDRARSISAQVGAALQLATALRAQAATLQARALASGPLTWGPRYRAALDELDGAVQRVAQVQAHGTDDWSALGFGDDEVPIYFGDTTGANAGFFASSDHIIRLNASSAVVEARRLLERAQANWAAFVSNSQQEQEGDEGARIRYGRPLRDLCGLTDRDDATTLADFASGAMSATSCYVKPSCMGSADTYAPSCVRGQLGEVAAGVAGARADVETARLYVADLYAARARQAKQCSELQRDLTQDSRLVEAHRLAMNRSRTNKAIFDQAANVYQASADIGPGDLLSAGVCRVIATACHAASIETARSMEELDLNYRSEMEFRANDQRIKACFHEADAKLDGLRTAASQLQQRLLDLETALLRLGNRQEETTRLAAEGAAVLANRASRGDASLTFRGWLGTEVERYRSQLRVAKHMTYLAIRAFEYETQQSSPWGAKVLRAGGPGVLEQALLEIQGRNVSRGINDRRPEAHHVRLSLRDQVLHLADQSDTPGARRHGTPRQRFSHHLASEAGAIFDGCGALTTTARVSENSSLAA